jgi:hypothetical protein
VTVRVRIAELEDLFVLPLAVVMMLPTTYPMGDDPHGVAEWIRHWHTTHASPGRVPQARNQTR